MDTCAYTYACNTHITLENEEANTHWTFIDTHTHTYVYIHIQYAHTTHITNCIYTNK